jgi:hypothetical protein
MTENHSIPWTFDAFLQADLERVYQQGKDEVLRDRVFRILLAHAGSVAALEQFAFHSERKVTGWATNELLEISNRFRLMSSPENEIRLYRECQNEAFRNSPRVREFYVLALTKAGRPAEAIREGAALIAQGGQNALVWGALAQSHMARMELAEHLLTVIEEAGSINTAGPFEQQLEACFPEVPHSELSAPQVTVLRDQELAAAARIFKQSFIESGNPYPGLGWMFCTLHQLCDVVEARGLLQHEQDRWLDQDDRIHLQITDRKIARLKRMLEAQGRLLEVSLRLQGGDESQDYWTHAGYLRLAVLQRIRLSDFDQILARTVAHGDAAFKHTIAIGELKRIGQQLRFLRESGVFGDDEGQALAMQAQCASVAVAELEAARAALWLNRAPPASADAAPEPHDAGLSSFLKQTINFHALIGNLVPVFIQGTIGRVGARVPDLLINRQVQQDLCDLIENEILPGLPMSQRSDPLAIIHKIQQKVGRDLNIAALQDLQSPSHAAFDIRSDGMIALSGVDHDLRKDTYTSTELTAAMLMQNCDCRETMYLNGALFASWQQMVVKRAMARAIQCLDLGYDEGFEEIAGREIPNLLRHQLRGGQVNIYVEGMAMLARYKYARNAGSDIPLEYGYGLEDVRAGVPLTRYALENAILAVTYADGARAWIEPKDPRTGKWQPIPHAPSAHGTAGGVPVLPDAGPGGMNLLAIHLLNQVESHAMTFLHDTQDGSVELCDGFYNEKLFNSPYAFSAGPLDLSELLTSAGLIRAGHRAVMSADGSTRDRAVYLQFTHYSQTRYATGLVAGDTANSLQFMGRTYHTDFKREYFRLEEGVSPIPALLERIHDWQWLRSQQTGSERSTLERQLTRLMLELAKEHPELLQLRDITAGERLISQDMQNEHVYLVLSGSLSILRNNTALHDEAGNPIEVTAGGLVGEISALRGTAATASVQGDAVVIGITQDEIKKQLALRPHLLAGLEDLANYRLSELARNGYTPA